MASARRAAAVRRACAASAGIMPCMLHCMEPFPDPQCSAGWRRRPGAHGAAGAGGTMAEVLLSTAEKLYIAQGLRHNVRADGRERASFRSVAAEIDVVSNTDGSARVKIGGTDILVGVKAEVNEPLPESPKRGRLEFSVDCSAGASPAFEQRGGQALSNRICQTLTRAAAHKNCLDLKKLCIIPGSCVWVLHVQVLVLQCAGGSLLDAISVAIRAALANTRIPNTEVVGDKDGDAPQDYDLSDDPYDVFTLDVERFPVHVTLVVIGSLYVVDASAEEEACATGKVTMAVNCDGNACGIEQTGAAGVPATALLDMLQQGRRTGLALIATLAPILKAAAAAEAKRTDTFLA